MKQTSYPKSLPPKHFTSPFSRCILTTDNLNLSPGFFLVVAIGTHPIYLPTIPRDWLASDSGKRLLKFQVPASDPRECTFSLKIVEKVKLPLPVHFKRLREVHWYHDLSRNCHYFISPEMKSCIDWNKRELSLELFFPADPAVLTDLDKVLIQLRLLISFLTVNAGGLPLHCSAVYKNTKALVFFGHSGSGKTTIARIMKNRNWNLLNDEYNLLLPDGESYRVYSTPFTRRAPDLINEPGGISVQNLFHLARGSFNVEPEPVEKQIKSLLQSVYLFPDFSGNREQLLDTVISVCSRLPPKKLYFINDDETAVLLDSYNAETLHE